MSPKHLCSRLCLLPLSGLPLDSIRYFRPMQRPYCLSGTSIVNLLLINLEPGAGLIYQKGQLHRPCLGTQNLKHYRACRLNLETAHNGIRENIKRFVDIYEYYDTILYRENVFLCNSHVYCFILLSVMVFQKEDD